MAYFLFGNRRIHREARTRAKPGKVGGTHPRELEQEIVRVSECKQMRIGQDLHDSLCQELVAIDCAAACVKADLEKSDTRGGDGERNSNDPARRCLCGPGFGARDLSRANGFRGIPDGTRRFRDKS